MAFSIRRDQACYLGCSIASAYGCFKKGIYSVQNFSKALFGSKPINDRVGDVTLDLLVKKILTGEIFCGEDDKKERIYNFKKGVKSALESLFFATVSYACITALNFPVTEEPIRASLDKANYYKELAKELQIEAIPLLEKWKSNICLREAIHWGILPKLKDCLDPSNIDPPIFQTGEWGVLDKNTTSVVYNCRKLMTLVGGVIYYKIDKPKFQLREVEMAMEEILKRYKSSVEKASEAFDVFLSHNNLNDWKQLWIGKLFSFNYNFFCKVLIYGGFKDLNHVCSKYENLISEKDSLLKKYNNFIPITERFKIDCSSYLVHSLSKIDLNELSLPNNFVQLIEDEQYQEIYEFFINHGGTKQVEKMKFDFNALLQDSCEAKEEIDIENSEANLILQRESFRVTGRSLNFKYRYLKLWENSNFKNESDKFHQNLDQAKGVVVL